MISVATVLVLSSCGGSDESSPTTTPTESTATDSTDTSTSSPLDPTPDVAEPAEVDGNDQSDTNDAVATLFPDVLDATATFDGATWTVSTTLSSPYDSPERYADAWRVVGPDGTVYAERILTHDHANEQPFTRSQSGIEIPADVSDVTIEGRDQISGYGGQTFELTLTR